MQGDWNEWGRHVLAEMKLLRKENEVLKTQQDKILEVVTKLRIDNAVLKIRTSLLGASFGVLGGSATHFLKQLFHS